MSLQLLVVDDEKNQRTMLADYLASRGHDVRQAGTGEEALKLLAARPADLVLTDLRLPGIDGVELLRRARARGIDAEFLVMTAFGTIENAVEAMRAGAWNYLTKPLRLDELDQSLDRAAERRRLVAENRDLKRRLEGEDEFAGLGAAMRAVCEMADRVAPSEATVLLRGESGVGKELLADRIHRKSRRARGPFVKINCAALPESLLEAELFGFEKGAFTGAEGARRGLFEAAHEGTLFLDEVGEMTPALQVRLLRVVQEREVMRIGARRALPVDVRLLAATHRNLEAMAKERLFREDLLYRLRVIEIVVPPLRERPEDIPVLAGRLLLRHAARNGMPAKPISTEALARLSGCPFPGNVRELSNVLERALILSRGAEIGPGDLPSDLPRGAGSALPARNLGEAVEALERSWIARALDEAGGVRAKAARLLGIPDRVLRYKLRKYGLDKNEGEGRREG
jgi:DNA-binding NtrC family response regulator